MSTSIPPEVEAVALLGWRVYPASRTSKAARFSEPSAKASCDLDVIAGWCRDYPPSNWRVVMSGSGIWGLDIDAPGEDHEADGIAAFKALVDANGPLPEKPMTRSGGGGYGMFFKDTGERIIGKTGVPAPGIDPRRGSLSLTIPPSIHVTTGLPYRWLVKPWEVSPPPAPAWLLKLVEEPPTPAYRMPYITTSDAARQRMFKASLAVVNAQPGCRNDTLNRKSYLIGRLIAGGLLGEQEAVEQLYGAARAAGLEHHAIRATIKSGIAAGGRNPWTTQ